MAEVKGKHFVRLANTDLEGKYPLVRSLQKIYGVGPSFARILCLVTHIDPLTPTGSLDDAHVKLLSDALRGQDLPSWLLNTRKNFETGQDHHQVSTQLTLYQEFVIKRIRRLKSYRGVRHGLGLPVRGQRTRSHFRKGRSLGVKRAK